MTDVSTTCAEAIFSLQSKDGFCTGCPSQDFDHPDDLFNQGMLLLGSNHFLNMKIVSGTK